MSIVRVGLGEDDKFAGGWEAIFGDKSKEKEKQESEQAKQTAESKEAKETNKK